MSFDNFIQWAAANVFDHNLWNLGGMKKYKNDELARTSGSKFYVFFYKSDSRFFDGEVVK